MAREAGGSELLLAVEEGDLNTVHRLCQLGQASVTNKHGESALHIAAGYGRLDIVRELLESGAATNLRDKQGDTPLYWGARHGHLGVVQHLVLQGASLNAQDLTGETAVHVSARYGHPLILAYLCQAGADFDLQDNEGDTPLSCACWHGYPSVVECLVGVGTSLNRTNADCESPLHIAAVRGHHQIVQTLCEGGARLDQLDKDGRSALHLSTKRNHSNIVRYLCEQGASVNIQDSNGDTPLHEVCREGQLELFHTLHSAHCQLNVPNKNGATPLHLAAKYGHTELARTLCLAGSDVNLLTEHGFHADEVSANHNHLNLASLLHHLRTGDVLDQYRQELWVGKVPLHRVRLVILGDPGAGKSQLVTSLSRGRLKNLFRPHPQHLVGTRPLAMSVHNVSFPSAGDFSVWEMSGREEYSHAHQCFLGFHASLYMVVYRLTDPPQRWVGRLRHWLGLLKSQHTPCVGHAGHTPNKLQVVLVGTFADQLTADSAPSADSAISQVTKDFQQSFTLHTHCLDCRVTTATKRLRETLALLRSNIIQSQPFIAPFTRALSDGLSSWQRPNFPVYSWTDFLRQSRAVNPLVTEQRLKVMMTALHNMGEVVSLSECGVVVLDPHWLGASLLTSLLSYPHTVTGQITLTQLGSLLPLANSSSVASLCEHLRLCVTIEDKAKYLFPCLIRMEPVYGVWERDPELTRYAGLLMACRDNSDSFPPGLFPRIQRRLWKGFPRDELSMWMSGAKLMIGGVEALLSIVNGNRAVQVLVRGRVGTNTQCCSLLTQLHSMVTLTLHSASPGTGYSTRALSPLQLMEHDTNPASYSPMGLHRARQTATPLPHPTILDCSETVTDLLYCGAVSADSAVVQPLPSWTVSELCSLLDPPDPLGRDWGMLALQLGLSDKAASIHLAVSPTAKLLEVWSMRGVLRELVDALECLGREDAAMAIIDGMSPFSGHYRISSDTINF